MLGGDLYSRVMLTEDDITEADIAGFVKQILSGKKLQKGILTRFYVLYICTLDIHFWLRQELNKC